MPSAPERLDSLVIMAFVSARSGVFTCLLDGVGEQGVVRKADSYQSLVVSNA
jgi:hypothetical protein